jgi:hypothetical protein
VVCTSTMPGCFVRDIRAPYEEFTCANGREIPRIEIDGSLTLLSLFSQGSTRQTYMTALPHLFADDFGVYFTMLPFN